MHRREFVSHLVGGAAWAAMSPSARASQAPAVVTSDRARPLIDYGVAAGLSGSDRAVVWAHVDRPGRMLVEYSTTPSFATVLRANGTTATANTGLTARAVLNGLPPGEDIFYRVRFEDLGSARTLSAIESGHFRSVPRSGRAVRVAWSADTCGQGWGIDRSRGGMRMFETMRTANPDLFINVGDTIYADAPLPETIALDDGSMWTNVVTPAKAKVAETLDEFRGNHLYNRLDDHYRLFSSEVAQAAMWDDHEVRDNWYREQMLSRDTPYTEKRVAVLANRGRQAFLEHYPIPVDRGTDSLIYRSIWLGPLLEVFALDMRSYRGANSDNLQTTLTAEAAFLGALQVNWLADALSRSTATWKIVAADMPIGLIVSHQPGRHEAVANGDDGIPRGRELEIAGLLRTLKERQVRNVIWITADVHYCAAHHYDPEGAAKADFDPFWEFVAGPAHAGTFAPGPLDRTFGPEVRFRGVPDDLKPNRPPDAGLQFFGQIDAEPGGKSLTVSLINTAGQRLFTQQIDAER